MKITKNKDHVLFKGKDGEYHLSLEEFNRLGEDKAKEFAEKEIKKKIKSNYSKNTIDFKKARSLGFCEYGIKDFCEKLNLDITKEYSLDFLNKKLTVDVLKSYPNECIKLFGKDTLKYLGGVLGILSADTLDIVLRYIFIDEKILHRLACGFAMSTLHNFERVFPDDTRPRLAIEAKKRWLNGEITQEELNTAARSAVRSAAESAAESAAWSAGWSAAESAARSAAESAARSAVSAAESAALSAARSAAWSAAVSAAESAVSAEKQKQAEKIRGVLGE